jgi:hypothetical protein
VERDRNAAADALSKLGSSRAQVPPGVFVQEVPRPSVPSDQAEECNALSQPESVSCNTLGVTMARTHLDTKGYDHMWKNLGSKSMRALES